MTWLQRYRLRTFLAGSLWPWPLASIPIGWVAERLVDRIDRAVGWTLPVSVDAARTVGSMMTSALLTFIVFLFSSILIMLQVASSNLTPRVIPVVLTNPIMKATSAVFMFTFTFSLFQLARMEAPVRLLGGWVMAYGSLACLGLFVVLIDQLGKGLRPVSVVALVANSGNRVIDSVYPRPFDASARERSRPALSPPVRVIAQRSPGYVLAFDEPGLVDMARRAQCVIEVVPQVGDFVGPGDSLFRVYGRADSIQDDDLRQRVALGPERTMEQDPILSFRILVDLASRALSPAINDPTTAVLALDQIHRLLHAVGTRQLDAGVALDAGGHSGLVYRTPCWDDFVVAAVVEIRIYGQGSVQITRRLHAMLDELIKVLPESRAKRLREELEVLRRDVERTFEDPQDMRLAELPDTQGIGGAPARPATSRSSL